MVELASLEKEVGFNEGLQPNEVGADDHGAGVVRAVVEGRLGEILDFAEGGVAGVEVGGAVRGLGAHGFGEVAECGGVGQVEF